jgi:hypothetical protein
MADKKDPTITSYLEQSGSYDAEGVHAPNPIEGSEFDPARLVYKDNPDKPDKSSVAQVQSEK